jgi:hypothetical protein
MEKYNEAIWERIEKKENGCWEWSGALTKNGVPQFSVYENKTVYTINPRKIILFGVGREIESGQQLVSVCGVGRCCNPEHLAVRRKPPNLDVKRAFLVEVAKRPSLTQYWFNCSTLGCSGVLKIPQRSLSSAKGKCKSCAAAKRPYWHIYNGLLSSAKARNHQVDITFEEFLVFTKTKECHYCCAPLDWQVRSTGTNHRYHLDRKDNAKGYAVDNCVVCCPFCNMLRQDKLTYDEFLLLGPALKQIALQRQKA